MASVQYAKFGALVRAVRLKLGLRQVDVAARVGIGQTTISRIERGDCGSLAGDTLDAVADALGIRLTLEASWQGARGDALLDRAHAQMVDAIVRELRALGWVVRVEYSFSRYGERGRVDIVALNDDAALLIIEVKTELGDVQETIGKLDVKARVVPLTVRQDLGWQPRVTGVVLVLPDAGRERRAIARHSATFEAAFPARGHEVRRWLTSPCTPLRGIWFFPNSHGGAAAPRSCRRKDRPEDRLGG